MQNIKENSKLEIHNIAKYRKEKGLSQKQLAEYLNISQTMIAQIEKGYKNPTVPLLKELSRFFGVTIDELVRNTAV
ncbi:MAG: helix-turn-helix transcriptional regulator [Defluviitaleaceae bacterium]|nr:helix-turn-helix transcriptional regulator [Defluviitaleaceae bacterium]